MIVVADNAKILERLGEKDILIVPANPEIPETDSVFEVDLSNFYRAVAAVRGLLGKLGGRITIRFECCKDVTLILAVLSAALSLDLEAEIEINEEERKFMIPIELFRPLKLDLIDLRILKLLSQGIKSFEDIVESLNVDRRIIAEKLKRLIEEGLVEGGKFSLTCQGNHNRN